MKAHLISAVACIALAGCAGTPSGSSRGIAFAESPEVKALAEQFTEEDPRMAEVTCRTEPVTGSRTRVNRVCLTRAEWRAIESTHSENVRTLQGLASGGVVCETDMMGGCS